MGPHPLLETEQQFLHRAKLAWDEAYSEITHDGLVISTPRKFGIHCEWLVRYHVCGQTAADILKDYEHAGRPGDETTIYKAVRSVAILLGVRLRSSSTT